MAVGLAASCLLLGACAAGSDRAAESQSVVSVLPMSGSGTLPTAQTPAENEAFFAEVKEYLRGDQGGVPESGRLHWSDAFLDAVDMAQAYGRYLDESGKAQDITAFASWLTDNAPVPDNWRELFEKALMDTYGQAVDRYEDLGDDVYQVYVVIDGKSVPYVAVNARTGWYHG